VALAAELGCQVHLLKAEVDGVYSSDPRKAQQTTRIDHLGYEEAVELARNGAKVVQEKAVELAQKHQVPVWVRRTFGNGPGTWIG
jgi:aspartate kinase